MANYTYFTEEGLKKIREELKELKTKGRANMAKQIQEAREKGDLSENAEYDAAKEAQGMLEKKISEMEAKVSNAKVIDKDKLDASKIMLLSNVALENIQNGNKINYQVVPEAEADVKAKKISVSSPIGKGLLGKKVGEVAEIAVPSGMIKFKILDISL